MIFTSPVFLMIFLPLMIALYWILPARWRRGGICIFSIAFYMCANIYHPASLAFLFICAGFTYCAACAIKASGSRRIFAASLLLIVGTLVLLRFISFFASERAISYLPLGAAFYLLSCISCITDVKRGDAEIDSFFDVFLYVSYFPVLIAGPVIKYKDFIEMSKPENMDFGPVNMGCGVRTFMLGFIKRVGIAAFLLESYDIIVGGLSPETGERISPAVMLILALLLLLGVFFAFSGFSDMGRGISMVFGIAIAPDFGNCLLCTTPSGYFENFMNSLWRWLDDYIRIPIEKMIGESRRLARAVGAAVVCVFIMIWYRSSMQMLVLMIPITVFVSLDLAFSLQEKLKSRLVLRVLGSVLTMICMIMFWVLIKSQNVNLLIGAVSGSNPAPTLQAYNAYMTVFSRELVAICLLMLLVMLPELLSLVKKPLSARTVNLISCGWTGMLLAVFVMTVIFVLPQYPELSLTPFSGITL